MALYLTFTHQWKIHDIEPGTKEAEKAQDDHMRIAVSSVQGTIKALRKLAEEGKLWAHNKKQVDTLNFSKIELTICYKRIGVLP